jgi:hypothetical protein
MSLGTSGPQTFVRDPAHARLVAESLADMASKSYPHRKAYQVLRSLAPAELYEMVEASRAGGESFRRAFGPVYHRYVGDDEIGELFAGDFEAEVEL